MPNIMKLMMNKYVSALFKDCSTCRNYGLIVLRIGIGYLILTNHGWDKLTAGPERWEGLGTFGMQHLGITFLPVFWGFMAAFSESIGAIMIALGLGTRIGAGLLMITMLVGVNMHIATGKGSSEMALIYAFASAAIMLTGAGDLSLDKILFSKDK